MNDNLTYVKEKKIVFSKIVKDGRCHRHRQDCHRDLPWRGGNKHRQPHVQALLQVVGHAVHRLLRARVHQPVLRGADPV